MSNETFLEFFPEELYNISRAIKTKLLSAFFSKEELFENVLWNEFFLALVDNAWDMEKTLHNFLKWFKDFTDLLEHDMYDDEISVDVFLSSLDIIAEYISFFVNIIDFDDENNKYKIVLENSFDNEPLKNDREKYFNYVFMRLNFKAWIYFNMHIEKVIFYFNHLRNLILQIAGLDIIKNIELEDDIQYCQFVVDSIISWLLTISDKIPLWWNIVYQEWDSDYDKDLVEKNINKAYWIPESDWEKIIFQ